MTDRKLKMSLSNEGYFTADNIVGKQIIRESDGAIRILDNKTGPILWNEQKVNDLIDDLTGQELRAFLKLTLNVNSNGYICYLDAGGRKHIIRDEKKLRDITGLTKKTAWYNFKKKATKHNLIFEGFTKGKDDNVINQFYLLNPVYAIHSYKWITPDMAKAFGKDLMPFLDKSFYKTMLLDEVMNTEGNVLEKRRKEAANEVVADPNAPIEIQFTAPDGSIITTTLNEEETLTKSQLFGRYVLRVNRANIFENTWYYKAYKNGQILCRGYNDNAVNLLCTPNKIKAGHRLTPDHIKEYNNCYINVAVWKDDMNVDFSEDMIRERKKSFLSLVVAKLPKYTALVETFNGYNVYWSLDSSANRSSWINTQQSIIEAVTVTDPTVIDPSKLLPLHGSIQKENNIEPFHVSVEKINEIRYNFDSLKVAFEHVKGIIQESCEQFLKLYPDINRFLTQKKKHMFLANLEKRTNKKRILEIRKLQDTTVYYEAKEMNEPEFAHFIRHQNLRTFLGIKKHTLFAEENTDDPFCCVLPDHVDVNISATVFSPETDDDRYVYICSCCTKPLDIVDIVQEISGCNKEDAIRYLKQHFNVTTS